MCMRVMYVFLCMIACVCIGKHGKSKVTENNNRSVSKDFWESSCWNILMYCTYVCRSLLLCCGCFLLSYKLSFGLFILRLFHVFFAQSLFLYFSITCPNVSFFRCKKMFVPSYFSCQYVSGLLVFYQINN